MMRHEMPMDNPRKDQRRSSPMARPRAYIRGIWVEVGTQPSRLAPRRFHCFTHLLPTMGDKTRMIDEMLSRAIHANPNDPYAWHMLGVRCFSQKFFDEALHCFQKAETIKEEFSASNLYYLGACLKEQGKEEQCKVYLRKAVHAKTRNAVDEKGRQAAAKLLRDLQLGNST